MTFYPQDPTENPWKSLSTKKIYDNPWIELHEDRVLKPNGKEGLYGKVHFKNYAIGIVPVDENGYTYLVGQHRYPLDEYSWEIPMGGGPMEDDILDSAKRELKEETGFTAKNWKEILKIHTSNSVTDETGYVFLATDLTAGEWEPEDTEVLQVKKIKLSEAFEWASNGKITDSVSIGGLFKAYLMLK